MFMTNVNVRLLSFTMFDNLLGGASFIDNQESRALATYFKKSMYNKMNKWSYV